MLYLNVPFLEKADAKTKGAKWDSECKKWFVPDGVAIEGFSRWFIREKKRKLLLIEVVPKTAWFSNLRSELTWAEWKLVQQKTFRKAHGVCEICGKRGLNGRLDCHEQWSYGLDSGVQTLDGTIALCPSCHEVKHWGLTGIRGRLEQAQRHIMQINGWTEGQVDKHVVAARNEWVERSKIEWRLDARWLLSYVDVSKETRGKILGYAQGEMERPVFREGEADLDE